MFRHPSLEVVSTKSSSSAISTTHRHADMWDPDEPTVWESGLSDSGELNVNPYMMGTWVHSVNDSISWTT